MKKLSLNHLRLVSLMEGISYILLIGIGMPLKYGLGIPSVNMGLGAAHGVLTIVFCLILALAWAKKTLTSKWCVAVFILSIIPFGAFIAEKKLKELSNK